MNAEELYKRILEYGADESGIRDRFMGDAAFYKLCFDEFIVEANFDTLREALAAKDYGQAFEAAHAIKGLAGNLGVTAFNEALHALVESLRSESYARVDAEYAEVARQHRRLLALAAEKE